MRKIHPSLYPFLISFSEMTFFSQVYYSALKVYQSVGDNSRKFYLFNVNYINLQIGHLKLKMGYFLFSFHFAMLRTALLS